MKDREGNGPRLLIENLVTRTSWRAFRDIRYIGEDDATTPWQVLIKFFSEQFNRHRSGSIVDLNLLKTVATNAKRVSAHLDLDEPPFDVLEAGVLAGARGFYRQEAETWSKHASKEVYSAQVPQRIQEETERCTMVMGEASAAKIARAMKEEFDKQYQTHFLPQSASLSTERLVTERNERASGIVQE